MRSVTTKHNHQTTLQYLSYFQHPGASNQSTSRGSTKPFTGLKLSKIRDVTHY
jgi:hypothetical protein